MSKRKLILCVAVFNALMIVAFIFSNIYLWGIINPVTTNGMPLVTDEFTSVSISPLQMTVHHMFYSNGSLIQPGEPESGVQILPNYPFILFWVAIVGNLVLIALILRNPKKKSSAQTTVS